jgi:hypothetical protein
VLNKLGTPKTCTFSGLVVVSVVTDVVTSCVVDAVSLVNPDDPDDPDPNEHTSSTSEQQSPFTPQNSSQKQAEICVFGWSTLLPQLSAHEYDPSNPSVVVVTRVVVVLVVLFTTSIPLASARA